ncbi:hypothetical protein C7271_15820 [filamentous cyanobacterium CCP5]|nr:hypothetical protein C7271_15820 [filamentous cyanobacterium CCP5]
MTWPKSSWTDDQNPGEKSICEAFGFDFIEYFQNTDVFLKKMVNPLRSNQTSPAQGKILGIVTLAIGL